MVDKDAFEEIIENGWKDMKGTDMNKDGQTLLFQIALYYLRNVQVKQFVVGEWCWRMVEVFGCV